jgi:hypothetical protein
MANILAALTGRAAVGAQGVALIVALLVLHLAPDDGDEVSGRRPATSA